jgi:hypothetical protein
MYLLVIGINKTFAKRHIWFSILPEQSVTSLDITGRNRFPNNNIETLDYVGSRTTGVQIDVAKPVRPGVAKGAQPYAPIQRYR